MPQTSAFEQRVWPALAIKKCNSVDVLIEYAVSVLHPIATASLTRSRCLLTYRSIKLIGSSYLITQYYTGTCRNVIALLVVEPSVER